MSSLSPLAHTRSSLLLDCLGVSLCQSYGLTVRTSARGAPFVFVEKRTSALILVVQYYVQSAAA